MKINVPDWAREHFWEEPPEGSMEFWAFRFMPPCKIGDVIEFCFDRQLVARAVVGHIEAPSLSACDSTGRFRHRWKVFWSQESFEDLREPARPEKL